MSDIAIRVKGLGKQYRIGKRQASYGSLRESLTETVARPFRAARSLVTRNGNGNGQGAKSEGLSAKSNGNGASATHASPLALSSLPLAPGSPPSDTIWALKDVSFEVTRGEVVGIIGRNGAGKSTLLKVLSRITEPTTGAVDIYGRVGSLLEVGTGFHPELTGRENTFLNGAILGMRRAEIERKFDEIVAFAEIDKFLDTPVKYYSSGMYIRLAFAVAAHLEPEILLVDEVLAVGDAAFQKKCLGRMGDVAKEGRTVVFVSHNMIAVQSLCNRVLWLDRGETVENGPAGMVVSNYLNKSFGGAASAEEVWPDTVSAPGNDLVRLHAVRVRATEGDSSAPLTMQTPFSIEVEYWNLRPDAQLDITLHLYTEHEIIAFTTGSGQEPQRSERRMTVGLFRSVCYVPGELLNAGRHRFNVLVVRDRSEVIYSHESKVTFEIVDLQERGLSWYGRAPGVVQPVLKWTTERLGGSQETIPFKADLFI